MNGSVQNSVQSRIPKIRTIEPTQSQAILSIFGVSSQFCPHKGWAKFSRGQIQKHFFALAPTPWLCPSFVGFKLTMKLGGSLSCHFDLTLWLLFLFVVAGRALATNGYTQDDEVRTLSQNGSSSNAIYTARNVLPPCLFLSDSCSHCVACNNKFPRIGRHLAFGMRARRKERTLGDPNHRREH